MTEPVFPGRVSSLDLWRPLPVTWMALCDPWDVRLVDENEWQEPTPEEWNAE